MRSLWTGFFEKLISFSKALILLYSNYYKEIVGREAELVNLVAGSRLLCIGGGSVPCTAMLFSEYTGANVDVIDIDHSAVGIGQRVVKMFGLEDKIRVMRYNGLWMNMSDYQAVHIALQVRPKQEVLDHICRSCSKGTKVIIRIPKESLAYDYSNIDTKKVKKEECEQVSVGSKFNTMDDSLLMVVS